MEKYFLGHFINQDGVCYARVYEETMPEKKKNALVRAHNSRPSDVYDQLFFCSKEYFEQCKSTGWAVD